jgi:hypothetical protein
MGHTKKKYFKNKLHTVNLSFRLKAVNLLTGAYYLCES